MEDDPSTATRRKKDSSMTVALTMLKNGEGDAMVSAGSTGALLTGATLIVKRIKGVRRAAMAPVLPSRENGIMLIDCGANAECTPEYLLQFAYMGSFYARRMMGLTQPRVGLLNIGAEETKGGALQHETYKLLKKASEEGRINFVGNVEGSTMLLGGVDVVVSDGFSGNIVLKTAEGVAKWLPKLAVPTVIAQLVNMLYNIVDRIYIGHIPEVGSLALTGIGVCMPLILIVSAFSAFVASGGAPRASIFMGRGDCDSAERTLGGCLTMQVIISLLLTAAMLIWKDELLYLFGASENTIYYAADYMGIYALGTIFVQITLGLNAFITAQGFAKVGMKTVIIGAVLNIVLDPVFIFALGMGVKGAALATIISQAVSCAWVISFLCGGKTVLRLKKENLLPGNETTVETVAATRYISAELSLAPHP